MKKQKINLLIFGLGLLFASCGHDHNKDKYLGNIHDIYGAQLMDTIKIYKLHITDVRKKVIDSMRVVNKNAPEGKGWYSAKENRLPTGIITAFNPEVLDYDGPGPYLVTMKGFDGKLTINTITRKQWLMFSRGDVFK